MEPLWALLKSARNDDGWNPAFRGALRSAIAGRQWPQTRGFSAGWLTHNRCLLCVNRGMRLLFPSAPLAEVAAMEPAPEVLDDAPVGNLHHRIWACPALHQARERGAPLRLRLAAARGEGHGDAAFERGLSSWIGVDVPAPKTDATFVWIVRPSDGTISGDVYTDGSRLDGTLPGLARNGWSFVVIDQRGVTTAAARGVPPSWITDIPGTEAWALLQAISMATPGACRYFVDCKPCVDSIHRGRRWATSAKRPHARVNALLHTAFDDTQAESVVWMPAHTREHDVGVRLRGDGHSLTAHNRHGNDLADGHAKVAVEEHRAPAALRAAVRSRLAEARSIAVLVARATHLASNMPDLPTRDAGTSRAAAVASRKRKLIAIGGELVRRLPRRVAARPLELGGHKLVQRGGRWLCLVCKRSARWEAIAPRACVESAAKRWARKAELLADTGRPDGGGHTRVLSGEVLWCRTCGAYASTRAVGLATPCVHVSRDAWGGGRHASTAAAPAIGYPPQGSHPPPARHLRGRTRAAVRSRAG